MISAHGAIIFHKHNMNRTWLDRVKICKKPIAKYDSVTQKAYIEYEDGVKKYVN